MPPNFSLNPVPSLNGSLLSMSCPMALRLAMTMPNQRATWLPVKMPNPARVSTMPTISVIQPQVRRSLKT